MTAAYECCSLTLLTARCPGSRYLQLWFKKKKKYQVKTNKSVLSMKTQDKLNIQGDLSNLHFKHWLVSHGAVLILTQSRRKWNLKGKSTSQRWPANTNTGKGLSQTANAYRGPIKHLIALSGRECCHILLGHQGKIYSFSDPFQYSNPFVFEQ